MPLLYLYLLAIFSLSIVNGVQIIAIPWLALDYLSLSSIAIGLIQASVLLPSTLLLLLGGMSADRGEASTKCLYFFLLLSLAHAALWLGITQHYISLWLLLIYGLFLGVINAYLQPYKDYLVGSLSGDQLQSSLAKSHLVQSSGQITGIALATLLYTHGPEWLPLSQVFLLCLTAVCFMVFRSYVDNSLLSLNKEKASQGISWNLMISGIQHCWKSLVLRSLIIIVATSGFFHIGVFMVALPILAKQAYIGAISLYSLLYGLFIAGTVLAAIVVIIRGYLDSPGRRVIFNVLYAGLILLALSYGPAVFGLMVLIFLWGVVVGVSASLGRAILQSQTTTDLRGRAISVYQLVLFGSAPLGALFAGVTIEYLGVLMLLKISAIASLLVFFSLFLTKALWSIEAEDTVSSA